MFNAVISAGALEALFRAVGKIVDECKINVSPEGFDIRAVDLATVAMVNAVLPVKAFKAYQAEGGAIAVDVKKLLMVLRDAPKDGDVSLMLDEVAKKLNVKYAKRNYNVGLLDPSSIRKEPKLPNLSLPAEVEISPGELSSCVKAVKGVSDCLTIICEKQAFKIDAKGDLDSLLMEPEAKVVKPGECRSMFSLDYMLDVAAGASGAANILMEFGSDYPVKMTATWEAGFTVIFLVAPRIESE